MSFAIVQHPATHARSAGFTLIELLVASLLMGMLVTILTMVFNASSIAWRTGKAGVSEMNAVRQGLAIVQKQAENVLPRAYGDNMVYVTGAWDFANGDNLRTRPIVRFSAAGRLAQNKISGSGGQAWQYVDKFDNVKTSSGDAFVVGVWSAGPDGKWDTSDDISSWPEDEGK